MSLAPTKPVSLSYGGIPLNITRKRKNSNDHNDRVNRAMTILNDISSSRPKWGVTDKKEDKRDKSNFNTLQIETCAICVTDINENEGRYITKCGHSFHLECILPWFERSTICPMCREDDRKFLIQN